MPKVLEPSGSYRFSYKSASAYLTQIDTHMYLLASLWSDNRRQGHARKLMEEIEQFVVEESSDILLIVAAYDQYGRFALTNQDLIDFYLRLGFYIDDPRPPVRMIWRHPDW